MEGLIRAFILSENRLFREALERILSKKSDFKAVCSHQLGSGVIEEIIKSSPDVLVLDSASFLVRQGAQLSQECRGKLEIKTVLVSMEEDEELFFEVVRLGAVGYVPREASAMDVVAAIRAVARGEAVCPPRLCRKLFSFVADHSSERSPGSGRPKAVLTRREDQLLPMIGQGLTNKEIASQLNLSEKTVKNHVHRILQKLRLNSRLALMAEFRTNTHPAPGGSTARSLSIS